MVSSKEVLAKINKLEGHPNDYRRTKIKIKTLKDGKAIEAEAYLFHHPKDFNKDNAAIVLNGEWRKPKMPVF